MNAYKKIVIRSICIILAVVITPLVIFIGLNYGDVILNATGSMAASSAKMSFGNNTDYITELSKKLGATLINEPSTEFYTVNVGGKPTWAIDMAPNETEANNDPGKNTKTYKSIVENSDSITVQNPLPYPDEIENHDGDIEDVHYGTYSDKNFVTLNSGAQVRNCTELSNKKVLKQSEKSPDFNIELNSDEPQVLIYHTHTTESFEPYTRDYYDDSFSCKTTDSKKNMIRVGNAICKQLEKNGIKTVHSTTIHDYPDYNSAYDLSYNTVSKILKKYPSIKVVLDIHRDAIEKENGLRLSPITEVEGKRAAQLMIISCADYPDGSMGMPNYMKNLSFACSLQSQIEVDYPGLERPILFDYRNYNQSLSTGALLIEVGSHGNSLNEAVYTGKLLGKSLSNNLINTAK